MALIGIPIGLYGYLFPVNINIMVMELYTSKRYRLIPFVLALIMIFESIYCVLCLTFLNTIKGNTKFYVAVDRCSFILIFVMGLWMLLEKRNNQKAVHQNTILRGIFNIIIHPQQIPFWVVAGIFLSRVIQLDIHNPVFDAFVFFNAIGTLLAMLLYMIYGNWILKYFKVNIAYINKLMGACYILLALYHWLWA